MATINLFTGGGNYRDATRGATIKALEERRKALEDALTKASQPTQVNHPLQGVAGLAETMSAGIREGRAANEAIAGRQRLAELMAGGLTPDEYGEAMGLDPEITGKYIGHDWDTQAAKDRVQAEKDAAAALAQTQSGAAATKHGYDVTDAATLAETQRKQAEDAARIAEAKANADLGRDITKETKKEEITGDRWGPVTPDIAAKYGPDSDVAKNPGAYHVNARTGDIEKINTSTVGIPSTKEVYDAQDKLASIDAHMDDLHRALDLNDQVIQGAYGKGASELAGQDPTGYAPGVIDWINNKAGVKGSVDATKEYNQLVSSGAMTRMAEELKGSTAYQEILHYQEIFASPTASATVRRNALQGMLNVLQKHRAVSEARLKGYGVDAPAPYTYTPRGQAAGDTAQPPAASGGGNWTIEELP